MNQKAIKQIRYDMATWAHKNVPRTFEIVNVDRKLRCATGTFWRLYMTLRGLRAIFISDVMGLRY